MLEVLRTPRDRFAVLPGWPYVANFHRRMDGLSVHYVDSGPPRAGQTWLCLHGQSPPGDTFTAA